MSLNRMREIYLFIALGEGRTGCPAGSTFGELVVGVTCDECRAQMCTDDLLSNLRCAECRQIKFEQFFDVGIKAVIFTLGSVCAWLLLRRLKQFSGYERRL